MHMLIRYHGKGALILSHNTVDKLFWYLNKCRKKQKIDVYGHGIPLYEALWNRIINKEQIAGRSYNIESRSYYDQEDLVNEVIPKYQLLISMVTSALIEFKKDPTFKGIQSIAILREKLQNHILELKEFTKKETK